MRKPNFIQKIISKIYGCIYKTREPSEYFESKIDDNSNIDSTTRFLYYSVPVEE